MFMGEVGCRELQDNVCTRYYPDKLKNSLHPMTSSSSLEMCPSYTSSGMFFQNIPSQTKRIQTFAHDCAPLGFSIYPSSEQANRRITYFYFYYFTASFFPFRGFFVRIFTFICHYKSCIAHRGDLYYVPCLGHKMPIH